MSYRIVKKIVTGRQAIDGAGVHLRARLRDDPGL